MCASARKIYIIPVLLFVLAICLHFYAGNMLTRYRWVLLDIPIDLKLGITKLPEFQVDISTEYVIELVSERNLPIHELNCLLGTPYGYVDECKNEKSPVDLSWKLTSNGNLLASGSSRENDGASWGERISRVIGRFNGELGILYKLEVNSLKDASALSSTNPRICVVVNSLEYKNHYVNSGLVDFCALLVAVLGLAKLVAIMISHYRLGR